MLKQQSEILQNVVSDYSGLCETVRLRVREWDLEEPKMFIRSSLKNSLKCGGGLCSWPWVAACDSALNVEAPGLCLELHLPTTATAFK